MFRRRYDINRLIGSSYVDFGVLLWPLEDGIFIGWDGFDLADMSMNDLALDTFDGR